MAIFYADVHMLSNMVSKMADEVHEYLSQTHENLQDKYQQELNKVKDTFDEEEQKALADFEAEREAFEEAKKAYDEAMAAYAKECSDAAAAAAEAGESYTPPSPPQLTSPTPPEKPEINYEGRRGLENAIDAIISAAETCNQVCTQVEEYVDYIQDTIVKCDEAEDCATRILKFDFDRVLDGDCQKSAGFLNHAWKNNYVDDNYKYDSKPMEFVYITNDKGEQVKIYTDTIVDEKIVDGKKVIDSEKTKQNIAELIARFGDSEDTLHSIGEMLGKSTIPLTTDDVVGGLQSAGVASTSINTVIGTMMSVQQQFQSEESKKTEVGEMRYNTGKDYDKINEKLEAGEISSASADKMCATLEEDIAKAEALGDKETRNKLMALRNVVFATGMAMGYLEELEANKDNMTDAELNALAAKIDKLLGNDTRAARLSDDIKNRLNAASTEATEAAEAYATAHAGLLFVEAGIHTGNGSNGNTMTTVVHEDGSMTVTWTNRTGRTYTMPIDHIPYPANATEEQKAVIDRKNAALQRLFTDPNEMAAMATDINYVYGSTASPTSASGDCSSFSSYIWAAMAGEYNRYSSSTFGTAVGGTVYNYHDIYVNGFQPGDVMYTGGSHAQVFMGYDGAGNPWFINLGSSIGVNASCNLGAWDYSYVVRYTG